MQRRALEIAGQRERGGRDHVAVLDEVREGGLEDVEVGLHLRGWSASSGPRGIDEAGDEDVDLLLRGIVGRYCQAGRARGEAVLAGRLGPGARALAAQRRAGVERGALGVGDQLERV